MSTQDNTSILNKKSNLRQFLVHVFHQDLIFRHLQVLFSHLLVVWEVTELHDKLNYPLMKLLC